MDLKTLTSVATGIAIGAGWTAFVAQTSGGVPAQSGAQKPLTVADFPDLVSGLRQTPGVLDVKVAVVDKKQTIFAWFKNRDAVQAWYTSPMHRDAMRKFFPNLPGKPQAAYAFADAKAPILVVASVTPGDKPLMEGSPLHASQIAIELYTPVPGGLTIGGGFGPKNLEVPGMVRLDAGSGK